jgi:selenocysteine lyase/cysteine desulfurase
LSRSEFFREEFPALDRITFLNTAFCSPVARSVYEANWLFLDERLAMPDAMRSWDETTEETRGLVARLIGAEAGEIAFATAAAMGANIVAEGLSLGPGDNVVLDDLAYPTDTLVWRRRAEERGFEARTVGNVDGAVPLEAMADAVDEHTRLIAVSEVSYINGFRHELRKLADLAHRHGAYLLSDSTQSVGAVRLKVRDVDVDFVTCGAYKWLLGPIGLAFFYIKTELQERLPPLAYGWKQISKYVYSQDQTRAPDVERCSFFDDARRYEFASLNIQGMYELRAALQLVERIGPEWIEQRTLNLNRELRSKLLQHGFELFTPFGSDSGITTYFAQIRVSPHFYNTREEIDLFVSRLVQWTEA